MFTDDATADEAANDMVQLSGSREECEEVLAAMPPKVLRIVADLNYLSTKGRANVLRRRILDDVYPESRAPGQKRGRGTL